MRIVSWNLGHQTRALKLPATFVDAVKALEPDVLVLNEYVHSESPTKMFEDPLVLGFTRFSVSPHIPGQNQVLLASRSPHAIGDLTAPTTTPAATSNFLHVSVSGIEVVGMRAPAYPKRPELEAYWKEMEQLIAGSISRRILFIGDMNCAPERPRMPGGQVMNRLLKAGWAIPTPVGDWSYISKNGDSSSRIDHAICGPHFPKATASYKTRIGDIVLAGSFADKAISDHAALVLDLELGE